jgi:hypothetical protein
MAKRKRTKRNVKRRLRHFRIALYYEDGSVAPYRDDSFKSEKGARAGLPKIPLHVKRLSPRWLIERELEVEDPDGSIHSDWEEVAKGSFQNH